MNKLKIIMLPIIFIWVMVYNVTLCLVRFRNAELSEVHEPS
jgi:hypothetical protein